MKMSTYNIIDMSKKKLSKIEEMRASAGFVKDYAELAPSRDPKHAPNVSQKVMDDFLNLYMKDAVVAGAIDTVGEETVRNKGYFIGSKSAIEKAEKLFKKLDFYSRAEVSVKTQHIYGDSFMEIVFGDNGELDELHNLETTEMRINYNKHGDIISYTQSPFDIVDSKVKNLPELEKTWSADSNLIKFMPLKPLGSKVRSYLPLEPA